MANQNQNESTCCQECKEGNLQGLIFCNYHKRIQPAHVSDIIWGFIQENYDSIDQYVDDLILASEEEYPDLKDRILQKLRQQLHAYIEERVDSSARQDWFDKVNQDHQEMMSAKTIGGVGVRVGVAPH